MKYDRIIYNWVKENYGQPEADDPSWNIKALADCLRKAEQGKDYQEEYKRLAGVYNVPARGYLQTLKLAIYKTDGKFIDSSAEVAKYPVGAETWKLATELLTTLYGGD